MVSGERPIIAMGNKCNSRKVLSFVAIGGAGITTLGFTYLSKYPDQFSNASISPVAHHHLMSKFFGLVNEVDSHNKSCQLNLVLENLWATQCGWLRLCTTIATRTTVPNCWKLFCYGMKREHYDKLIRIRDFLELIDMDCFSNQLTTDTGNLEKYILYLGNIYN